MKKPLTVNMGIAIGILILAVMICCGKTEVSTTNCKEVVTLGYGYKEVFSIAEFGKHKDSQFTLHILVKAVSDAHILLSDTANPSVSDAVYEIVIGAGRNTFSEIRRRMGAQTKSRLNTLGYISNEEYRGFWIRMSRDGLLEVGKDGDNAPFLFWKDPSPLLIHHFSLSTWSNIVGKWLFDCTNETMYVEVKPNKLTIAEKLRMDLLTFYDPYTRPVINDNDVITILFQLICHHVKLDEKHSILTIEGEVTMKWKDHKLKWDPKTYGNISIIPILHHESWQPQLVLYNSVGHGTDILKDTALLVQSNGTVNWKTPTSMQVRCKLDLSQWPEDQHNCEIQIGLWSQHEMLHLQFMNNGAKVHEQYTGTEWEILSLQSDTAEFITPWINATSNQKKNKALCIHISLKRKPAVYKNILVVPYFVICTMTILSFWLSPLDSSKIFFLCVNLVVLSLFIIALGQILPAPSNHVPHLLLIYSHGMIAVLISLLISVLVIGFTRYRHNCCPHPKLCTLITAKPLQTVLFLPSITDKAATTYDQLQEMSSTHNKELTSTMDDKDVQQQYWVLLAIVVDRIACIIYVVYVSITYFQLI